MEGDIRCTVPVGLNVVEVQVDDGPQGVGDPCGVTVIEQPVSVENESGGSQSRAIPLGSTYIYSKSESRLRGGGAPQEPVKAASSIMNLGSPKPPVDSVPLRLGTFWMWDWERKNWSILPRRETSWPLATF